jgi:NAD(P)-dependent dehydrogenase (short-subunit alcohol dehydrogenase family)
MESLAGKVVLVTGGGSGIGRAVAERTGGDGAYVVVADVDQEAGRAAAAEVGGAFVHADVSDLEQNRQMVRAAVARYGGLDLVHLNAGVSTGEADLTALSEQAYRRAVGANVDGVVFGVQAAAAAMRPEGSIVVTASLAGLVPYPGDPIYGLTKHAVIGFVRATAPQLRARGIAINALCPGFVDTPILGPFADEFRARGFPLLQPADVAEAVVTVATSEHTGEVFVCQPGRLCERYEFRGVPGPRAEGAEGMAPPVHPGPGGPPEEGWRG